MSKNMASLTFIFCWCKHIFIMIIQIFTEKHFSSNFWTMGPLNMVDPSFFSAFWEIYILISHWWPISIPKISNEVEWGWMMANEIFFLKSMKTADVSKNITDKVIKCIILENNNIIAFQWGEIRQLIQRLKSFKGWETKKLMSARNFGHTQFCEITRKCVKLHFRKWKLWVINEKP